MGRNQVHELNRDHVAAGVAVALAGLRVELWTRMRQELSTWRVTPLYAAVFGSAARHEGNADSDIDLLVVHPPFPGESRVRGRGLAAVSDALGEFAAASMWDDAEPHWQDQLDALRLKVESWTGNPLQVVDLPFAQWRRPDDAVRILLADVERDGVELGRSMAASLWNRPRAADA